MWAVAWQPVATGKTVHHVWCVKATLVSRDSPEQLIIALEPEAASIYCRKLRLHQMLDLGSITTVNGSCPKENIESGMTPGTTFRFFSSCFDFL